MSAYEQFLISARAYWVYLSGLSLQDILTRAGITAVIVLLVFGGMKLSHWLLCRLLASLPGESSKEHTARAAKALRMTRMVIGLIVIAIAAMVILSVWGIHVAEWAAEDPGRRIVSVTFRTLGVLIFAALMIELIGLFSRRTLSRLRKSSADPRRAAQLDTVGPLIRRVLQMAVIVLAIITLLSQVGVEIAPILAGAGVVGVAVGFGAQTIVKDVLTGLFLIIEDIVAVGDIVQIGAFSGEVEDMTLRTIRLRDSDGTLHIFPYGESQVIHNMTKTFSFAASDLPVKYDTDLDQAMSVMRQTAAELRKDPEFGPLILDDLEIAGTDLLSDVGIIIKSRLRTQPLERWRVLREYNRRIKLAFDAAGIQITHK